MANKTIGYARVSKDDQNLDLQRDALYLAGCSVLYEEKISGGKITSDRPELDHCLKALRSGDTLVVWRLDRLGRSLKELLEIVGGLEHRSIHFKSTKENIDTGTAAGKLIFHIFASLAEFERNLIQERTIAGLDAARARGRKGGRKKSLTDKQVREAKLLLSDPENQVKEVAKRFKVARSTLYKYLQ